jgi:hypothetical protein
VRKRIRGARIFQGERSPGVQPLAAMARAPTLRGCPSRSVAMVSFQRFRYPKVANDAVIVKHVVQPGYRGWMPLAGERFVPHRFVAQEEIRDPIPGNFLRVGRSEAGEEKPEPRAHGNGLMIARGASASRRVG